MTEKHPEPLTEERLAEIEASAELHAEVISLGQGHCISLPSFLEELTDLLAEVRRLKAEIARIEQERQDEREIAAEQLVGEDW